MTRGETFSLSSFMLVIGLAGVHVPPSMKLGHDRGGEVSRGHMGGNCPAPGPGRTTTRPRGPRCLADPLFHQDYRSCPVWGPTGHPAPRQPPIGRRAFPSSPKTAFNRPPSEGAHDQPGEKGDDCSHSPGVSAQRWGGGGRSASQWQPDATVGLQRGAPVNRVIGAETNLEKHGAEARACPGRPLESCSCCPRGTDHPLPGSRFLAPPLLPPPIPLVNEKGKSLAARKPTKEEKRKNLKRCSPSHPPHRGTCFPPFSLLDAFFLPRKSPSASRYL